MAETSSDWVEILEPRSRERMYVNLATGECGWEPPPDVAVRQSDGSQWWELFDSNNNRFYYYNSASQQTVWHRPHNCDIVPLAQLQAVKRSSESEVKGHRGRHTPLPGAGPANLAQDPDGGETEAGGANRTDSLDSRKEACRDSGQRWQPAPGSKAALLVKVNSIGRNQAASHASAPPHHSGGAVSLAAGGQAIRVQASSSGRMAEPRQAVNLRKGDNGSFRATSSSSPTYQTPQRSQAGTPRPSSPKYGATPPIYDEPPLESPIYDEPPVEMEVEGAHSLTRSLPPQYTPSQSLQKQRLLPHPTSHQGSKHKRSPSATEYSAAGKECIKHMVNVDPGASRQPALSELTPPKKEADKKHSWRLLEAGVLKSMEARHSRQNSAASQEYGSPSGAGHQDSGYSTGPSPSLRRKTWQRQLAAQGRPGSAGSSGELGVLSEKLMAEVKAAVSRSSTLRGSKGSLDTEMCESSAPHGGGLRKHAAREHVGSSNCSLYRSGSHGDAPVSPLASEGTGRQKRTYEKVDSMEKSVTSQMSLTNQEGPRSPSQAGTLESKGQVESRSQGGDSGCGGTLSAQRRGPGPVGAGEGRADYHFSYGSMCKAPPDASMVDWASKNLNLHTQGLFRRRVSIANMLSWNRGSIKKPMLITSDRSIKKEACDMFKLVQAYMGDRASRLDRRHVALLIVTKCWGMQGLRDELYVQLVRQTTDNLCLRSLAAGWELMAVSLAFFSPSPKFRRYLEGYIQRHLEPRCDDMIMQNIMEQQDLKNKKNSKSRKKRKQNLEEEEESLPISTYAKYCYRKLQKVAVTGGKKGLRKPTLEEIDHGRNAIFTPSLFGSSLEEIMERQRELFPERRLPWVQVQLSQYVLALGGAQTEGIFRVPGDIDEVNALKLQVEQWKIPENLSDPNVPASLLKLWYRELEEPVIPQSFYQRCISNYDDPEAAIGVVQSLPELSRLVLCYFIHFLQVFAQPVNVSKTKMDVNNLAMVMAPNCLRCQSDDPRVIFENTRKEMSFLRLLIVHLDTSFIKGVV
ncbi:rho GTPase-activating protein 39-like [Paramormyrops kingsleyae]|uniref:rho GTPase-activating protein 39-like n=1 Tax=Paramormyrops kingsleyae TaxID=1676925 RepID=UPI003B97B001